MSVIIKSCVGLVADDYVYFSGGEVTPKFIICLRKSHGRSRMKLMGFNPQSPLASFYFHSPLFKTSGKRKRKKLLFRTRTGDS